MSVSSTLVWTFSRPLDTTLYGWVRIPAIVSIQDRTVHGQLEGAHEILSWTLALLVLIHIAGAFFRLWFRKDDVMRRMLPSAEPRGAAAAAYKG